jgi:hydrogenase-4 component B
MTLFLAGCAAVAIGGLGSLLFPKNLKGIFYAVCGATGLALLALAVIPVLVSGATISLGLSLPFPIGAIELAVDPLAAIFILILAFSNFTAGLYSTGYLKPSPAARVRLYYPALALLFCAMLLLVAVRQAFAFLFLWEIMSLTSFALVAFEHEKEETRKAAVYYFAAMQAGFACLLAGFVVLTHAAGSRDFAAFTAILSSGGPLAVGISLLLFAGFATKAGFFPFHTWLPKAHPAAPAPVSAVMSGVMIKTGIYGLLRIVLLMGRPPLALSVGLLVLSLATGLFGAIQAVSRSDLKGVLASSSIENIGIIGAGIGIGLTGLSLGLPFMAFLGFLGSLFHVLNHSLFKSLLFMGAGSVYTQTHTRDLEKMGGLARLMPVTSVFFLIGSLAISGLPLFNGFAGEFALYLGVVRGAGQAASVPAAVLVVTLALLALIGILALFSFIRAYGTAFLGSPRRKSDQPVREADGFMLAAQVLPAALIVFIGLFPQLVVPLFTKAVSQFIGSPAEPFAAATAGVYASLSTVFIVFAASGGGLLLVRALLLRRRQVEAAKTWDCGYQNGSARLQYTAGSFSGIVRGFFGLLLGLKRKQKDKAETKVAEAEVADIVETYAVNPFVRVLRKFFEFFLWVQRGNTQQYILYGIVFLLAIIILVFGLGG